MTDTPTAALFCEACDEWQNEARCGFCDDFIEVSAATARASHPWQTTLPTEEGWYLKKTLPEMTDYTLVQLRFSPDERGNVVLCVEPADPDKWQRFPPHEGDVWKGPLNLEQL